MQLAYVAGVFLMAGILFPIVLVLLAVVVDLVLAAGAGAWWTWKHRHDPSVSHYLHPFSATR